MKRRLAISISLLSCSMVAFQIALMQILSICQWNHFAYMVISVAMLGFGASGSVLAFLKKYLILKIETNLAILMFFTSLSITGILFLSGTVFGGFDSYLVFYQKSHYLNLVCSYLMLFVPFFLGASAIGLAYCHYASNIGRLYFADLAGSGMGGAADVNPALVCFTIGSTFCDCLPSTGCRFDFVPPGAENSGRKNRPYYIGSACPCFGFYRLAEPSPPSLCTI